MIRKIFLPTKIGSYYFFTHRIIGIEITKTHIYATVIKAHGNKRTIEQCLQEPIDSDTLISYHERAAQALKNIMHIIGAYDSITLALSGSVAVFKEITVPFADQEKIKMVVPFEVEALLPFALDQAVIDSIITSTDQATHKSEVLVAAVKRNVLHEQLEICALAGIEPTRVTLDVFEIYGLYTAIPEYAHQKEPLLLIYAGETTTSILCLIQGTLKGLRVIAKKASVQDIVLTRDMLSAKLSGDQHFEKIIVTGPGAESEELIAHIAEQTGIATEQLHTYKVIHNGIVRAKNTLTLSESFSVSLAAALSCKTTEDFNVLRDQTSTADTKLIAAQLIAALLLMVFTIGAFTGNSLWVRHKLNKEIAASEKEAINALTKEFNITPKKTGTPSLEVLISAARNEVAKRKSIWSVYSNQNRISFLFYLQELSTRIDREAIGLNLTQLTINENTNVMALEGEVKDYQALQKLEESLARSKIFTDFTKPQETKFTIKITLDKNYRED
jgi:Tfp pilus assembly protein, ATPase PilM